MDEVTATGAILAVAGTQHGLISRVQIAELKLSRRQVRTLLGRGWLEPVGPGVYGVAGAADSVERRLMHGLLVLGVSALVSHEAAARLHGFDRCLDDAVEFTVPRAHRNRGHWLRVHATTDLPAIDRTRVGGFPCTSATRTIIDLAAEGVGGARLEAAIDSAVRSGATAPSVLARRLEARVGPGWRGTAAVARLLPDTGGHSALERRFLALMRAAGLPRPSTQVVHRRGGRTFARVDFLFESESMVVEVSGRLGHASDAERARDAQRRNELQDVGQAVFEYTARQVFDEPDHVIATMRTRLASRRRPDARPSA
jgi:hypothetical protein